MHQPEDSVPLEMNLFKWFRTTPSGMDGAVVVVQHQKRKIPVLKSSPKCSQTLKMLWYNNELGPAAQMSCVLLHTTLKKSWTGTFPFDKIKIHFLAICQEKVMGSDSKCQDQETPLMERAGAGTGFTLQDWEINGSLFYSWFKHTCSWNRTTIHMWHHKEPHVPTESSCVVLKETRTGGEAVCHKIKTKLLKNKRMN